MVASISIAGSCLDVLGSLYLAYDLLGGQHGPLRLLTRAVTYSILFGLGYGSRPGPDLRRGVRAGDRSDVSRLNSIGHAKRQDHYPLPWEALFSRHSRTGLQRGAVPSSGPSFRGSLRRSADCRTSVCYARGVRPSLNIPRPAGRYSRELMVGSAVFRTAGYIAAALLCSAVVRHVDHPWLFALRLGARDGSGNGAGNGIQSLRRILCRQPAAAAHGSVWHRADVLRFCAAVAAILAGGVRCPRDLGRSRDTRATKKPSPAVEARQAFAGLPGAGDFLGDLLDHLFVFLRFERTGGINQPAAGA